MPRRATALFATLAMMAGAMDALPYCQSTALLLVLPTDTELLAICKSRVRDALRNELFHGRLATLEREAECVVSMDDRISLHADLVDHVQRRCTDIKDMKDAYVLLDCDVVGTNGGQRSEFWYFTDSANLTFAPDDAHRYTVSGSSRAQWEGDEVTATSEAGWEIFAYIDDTGASEAAGHYTGILEAGRRSGLSNAYECSRADDWTYPAGRGITHEDTSAIASPRATRRSIY